MTSAQIFWGHYDRDLEQPIARGILQPVLATRREITERKILCILFGWVLKSLKMKRSLKRNKMRNETFGIFGANWASPEISQGFCIN